MKFRHRLINKPMRLYVSLLRPPLVYFHCSGNCPVKKGQRNGTDINIGRFVFIWYIRTRLMFFNEKRLKTGQAMGTATCFKVLSFIPRHMEYGIPIPFASL